MTMSRSSLLGAAAAAALGAATGQPVVLRADPAKETFRKVEGMMVGLTHQEVAAIAANLLCRAIAQEHAAVAAALDGFDECARQMRAGLEQFYDASGRRKPPIHRPVGRA